MTPAVSIRHMLQNNKVDMTWMDLVAWSPGVAREIKRLCTRATEKKLPQAKIAPGQLHVVNQPVQFQPTFPQQYQPLPIPTSIPVPQPVPQTSQPVTLPQTALPTTQAEQLSYLPLSSSVQTLETERHTRSLSSMAGLDKAFRIPAVVKTPNGAHINLEKSYVQADQGSDMNVISVGLVR
ncbi:MAG: hypothetical protein Q9164_007349 [Protoblastenia rupestris]